MEELRQLVIRAQSGDLGAFGDIVRRFQNMARARAHSVLGDLDLAEDAAQESFIQAYKSLPNLREPDTFTAWFGSIVSNCSKRLIRNKRVPTVPLEDAVELASTGPDPAQIAEKREMRDRVLAAIRDLPEHERSVTQLFYFGGYSQNEIADFLSVPVTTVNSRLHSSRKRLRQTVADLAGCSPIERMSRSKERRHWLPSHFTLEETQMALVYEHTKRRLLRGDSEVTIRVMTKEDIPAMRALDEAIDAELETVNLQRMPGDESVPGGPWSDDQLLAEHFEKYSRAGNITLLAEDESGKLVGFVDLWETHEPEPFGDSLDVECIDYLREYYSLGLEIIFLEEAEKVARAAGLKALDIGTNTASGDYPSLRRFGMKVFYEFDYVWCGCKPIPADWNPSYRILKPGEVDKSGLLRVGHWSPSDFFGFLEPEDHAANLEFSIDEHRVTLELWPYVFGSEIPEDTELFAPPEVINSSSLMSKLLREVAFIAGEAGANEIKLQCPSDVSIDTSMVDVRNREFAFAWLRKVLD